MEIRPQRSRFTGASSVKVTRYRFRGGVIRPRGPQNPQTA